MNWRRGLVLAAINLAVAVPLVVSLELKDAAYVRDYYVPPKPVVTPPPAPVPAPDPKDKGVSFSPCGLLYHFPAQQVIAQSANAPALVLTGWRNPCPADWSLSGIMHVDPVAAPTPSSLTAQRKVDIGLLLPIPLQWILVGGFPLTNPKRPWREAGAFITGCAVLSVALVFIRPVEGLARVPALFAAFAWLWWFALLLWTLARAAWRIFRRPASALS